ncbi:hypothetical protein AO368_1584 [Moraxella catarrhalis]|nr:hypothetical protein AO368_1584 [Moraxella catarrhalis]
MAFLVYIDLSSDFILGISYPPYSLITILFIHIYSYLFIKILKLINSMVKILTTPLQSALL